MPTQMFADGHSSVARFMMLWSMLCQICFISSVLCTNKFAHCRLMSGLLSGSRSVPVNVLSVLEVVLYHILSKCRRNYTKMLAISKNVKLEVDTHN